MKSKKVLFLCTGNYYRSRFAEGLFNHLAANAGLRWRAESRGLAIDRTFTENVGPVSPYTLEAWKARFIPIPDPLPMPRMASAEDFASFDLIIALKEAEHRQMMHNHFPKWTDRVIYWHVHDIDFAPAEQAIREIDALVNNLVQQLSRAREGTAATVVV